MDWLSGLWALDKGLDSVVATTLTQILTPSLNMLVSFLLLMAKYLREPGYHRELERFHSSGPVGCGLQQQAHPGGRAEESG